MSTSDKICKDGASKNDDVCEVKDMLQNMSTVDSSISKCANCGKEDYDVNNICKKCNSVKYCNAACKKKHRSKHKKQCERRVAELHDKELFKQPPPKEDCPICFLRLPTFRTGCSYQSCCGKIICSGCIHAPVYDNQGNEMIEKTCPFCRLPVPKSGEDVFDRIRVLIEKGNAIAIYDLGNHYRDGTRGYPQDYTKALELWHRAAELGHAEAYCSIGYDHYNGRGTAAEVDEKKGKHYWELAAIRGSVTARNNLGFDEESKGTVDRALMHYSIAVRNGHANSLETIKLLYSDGTATKDDYTNALRLYQEYLEEIKSDQRDKAAAADERNRYY